MWSELVTVSGPAAQAVSTADAKAHCRVEGNDEDSLIQSLTLAAIQHVERACGLRLVAQTVAAFAGDWRDLEALPVAPVSAVTAIEIVGADGEPATLDAEIYETRLQGLSPAVVLANGQAWPSLQPGSRIEVTMAAGYANAAAVPPELTAAVKMLVSHWYENREAVSSQEMAEVPAAVAALLAGFQGRLI